MRILMMAGGTGGHIFPALAVAEAFRQQGDTVSWLGTADKLEARVVPDAGFAIDFIRIGGVRRKGVLGWLALPLRLSVAVFQAYRVMRKRKPDLVIGLGGYAPGPGGLAAWLARKPLVIHEQNAAAGLTNRTLAKLAALKLAAFAPVLGAKTQVIGNPLRADFLSDSASHTEPHQDRSFRLLVVGGSLGAKVLNEVVPAALGQLSLDARIEVRHQAGQATLSLAEQAYAAAGISANIQAFIDDMAAAYHWADCVICRAGALTVSELAVIGTPAIFVPLPHAVDDHQYKNSEPLVKAGAAICLRQNMFNAKTLSTHLRYLIQNPDTCAAMAQKMQTFAQPDATQAFIQLCRTTICS